MGSALDNGLWRLVENPPSQGTVFKKKHYSYYTTKAEAELNNDTEKAYLSASPSKLQLKVPWQVKFRKRLFHRRKISLCTTTGADGTRQSS